MKKKAFLTYFFCASTFFLSIFLPTVRGNVSASYDDSGDDDHSGNIDIGSPYRGKQGMCVGVFCSALGVFPI